MKFLLMLAHAELRSEMVKLHVPVVAVVVRGNVVLLCARTLTFPDPDIDGDADGF